MSKENVVSSKIFVSGLKRTMVPCLGVFSPAVSSPCGAPYS